MPLDKSVSLEQGAMAIINPLTATAFLEIAKKGGHKAVVLTAAASSLGQMANRLLHSQGLKVVNVVRRDEQVALLKEHGANIVLNSNEDYFDQKLHEACHQENAHLAFDAVAGPMTRAVPWFMSMMTWSGCGSGGGRSERDTAKSSASAKAPR